MDRDVFETERRLLFSIAYRMLGSASDAEDVLQDAWIRYHAVDPATIRSPKAFVTTIVTRLCLDRLKSAKKVREEYIGPWLPEPVLTSEMDSPVGTLQRAESVTLAFLVLLEELSPEERAVFLLKEIFDYDHAQVAAILETTIANSRQLLHRAKARLTTKRPQLSGTTASRRAVAERFAQALSAGDSEALTALLTRDVGVWSDGGGKVTAARRPLSGRDEVLRFLVGVHRTGLADHVPDHGRVTVEDVNSEPALIVRSTRRIEAIFVLTIDDGCVSGIRAVRNPEKLARITRTMTTLH